MILLEQAKFLFTKLKEEFLRRFGWPLVVLAFVGGFLGVVLSMFVHPKFESQAVLMSPKEVSVFPGAAALMGGFNPGAALSMKDPNEQYIGMLRSRTILDSIIAKFRLSEVYREPMMSKVRKRLLGDSHISAGKDGLIYIKVVSEDPELSANISNEFVRQLKQILYGFNSENSRRRIEGLGRQKEVQERRMQEVKAKLEKFATSAKLSGTQGGIQLRFGEIASGKQTYERLKIEVASLRQIYTEDNPILKQKVFELASVSEMLKDNRLDAPGKMVELESRLDSLQIEEKLLSAYYEVLAKSFEMEKLEDQVGTYRVDVVETAVPAEEKMYPRKGRFGMGGMLLGMMLGFGVAFLRQQQRGTVEAG
ncbi:MAG: hypothetical protein IPN71_03675 [Fibrobacteres bacterium]|nr:hypothetical protein [Fibrobacterota bacterium]